MPRRTLAFLALTFAVGTFAPNVDAFCGFYVGGADTQLFNNATQVVMMRDGTRTVLAMQNNYEGPPSGFALVVPVPVVLQKENVKTLPREIFAKVDALAAPRLVEYWEQDPCAAPVEYDAVLPAPMAPRGVAKSASARGADLQVTIEAQFTVGEYEIVILSAKDSGGLETWLQREKYAIPAGAEPFLRPYVQAGSKFFVAKVDPSKVRFDKGQAMLSPLRFHYDSESFTLPVRLGLMNAKGEQDLIVHILARGQRFEAANYPNVTIPTNLDVSDEVRKDFGGFYASLFDATLEKNPKAVVTEYSWSTATCDPCPGPTLSPSDLATLGGDVLTPVAMPKIPGPPGNGPSGRPMPPPMRAPGMSGFTITRLHARYTKGSLGEDLVFRAAGPIEGGREFLVRDADADDRGKLEHGSRPAQYGQNQFQGRYAIRHPWTGPITCEHPTRGRWGGPPNGEHKPDIQPALDLAFAKREPAKLASFLRSDAPELGIQVGVPAPTPTPAQAGDETTATTPTKGGCAGCSTTPGQGAASFSVLTLALTLTRRLRRKQR